MLRIPCPHCGERDEVEFRYRGDATLVRPGPEARTAAFLDHAYARANPRGWHAEWWLHAGGCRQAIKVLRHTVTHEIRAAVRAGEPLPSADGDGAS
jgi:heterotetrameric sarcosine oxidase delta subunit